MKYQVRKTNFVGEIGKVSYTSTMQTNKRLQFLKLKTNNDGVVQIDRVRVQENTKTVDLNDAVVVCFQF